MMSQLLTIPEPSGTSTEDEARIDLWAAMERLASTDSEMLARHRECVRASRLARRRARGSA
jgi:hypothetical protein